MRGTFSHYFGYIDADDDPDLSKYFYRAPLFEQIKKGDKNEGKFVIHGIKGAGKTAICRMLAEANASKIVCRIDKSFGFEVDSLGEYAAPIEGLLLTLLLDELANEIKSRKSEFSDPQSIKGVDNLKSRLGGFLKKVVGATKIRATVVEVDVQKILESKHISGFSRFKIADYGDILTPALKEKQGYILIDDVDDVFIGADKNAAFVEGLVRATKQINMYFGRNLHCLVFLKSGLFKLFFENAREYDKLQDFIISISWGKNELIELLGDRIKQKHGAREGKPIWRSWQLDFGGDNEEEIQQLQDYILDRCVSGPRDLIMYCNMAKEKAGSGKISMDDVKEVEDSYSKEKLAQINRDFGRTYPRIFEFLQQVFTGQRQRYTNAQMFELLNDRIIADERLQAAFGKLHYVMFATKENLVDLLYGIGFIGFKRARTSGVEFVITNAEPGPRILYTAVEYMIHNAYAQCLNLKN
jgi:hypothetical protein